MPQWVMNTLKIYGSEDELKRFFTENKGKKYISFQKSVPLTHKLTSKTQYEIEIEYESSDDESQPEAVKEAIELWGTKWDADDYKFINCGEQITYKFSTANETPRKWINCVSSMYPSLHFYLKAVNVDRDELIEGEWTDGRETNYNICSYAKHMYDQDGADRIAMKIIGLLEGNMFVTNNFLQSSGKFMEWLEDETDNLKENILVILDEEEAYDYIDYLYERIKRYLIHKSF